eukprot:984607-Alexandrium_andersonii.AAC.1
MLARPPERALATARSERRSSRDSSIGRDPRARRRDKACEAALPPGSKSSCEGPRRNSKFM